jgi:hypothetical protein
MSEGNKSGEASCKGKPKVLPNIHGPELMIRRVAVGFFAGGVL